MQNMDFSTLTADKAMLQSFKDDMEQQVRLVVSAQDTVVIQVLSASVLTRVIVMGSDSSIILAGLTSNRNSIMTGMQQRASGDAYELARSGTVSVTERMAATEVAILQPRVEQDIEPVEPEEQGIPMLYVYIGGGVAGFCLLGCMAFLMFSSGGSQTRGRAPVAHPTESHPDLPLKPPTSSAEPVRRERSKGPSNSDAPRTRSRSKGPEDEEPRRARSQGNDDEPPRHARSNDDEPARRRSRSGGFEDDEPPREPVGRSRSKDDDPPREASRRTRSKGVDDEDDEPSDAADTRQRGGRRAGGNRPRRR